MTRNPDHPTTDDLHHFRGGTMAPAAMLDTDDHLASCATCRERLGAIVRGTTTAPLLTTLTAGTSGHLSEQDVHDVVNNRVPDERSGDIGAHLALCEACAADVADLRAFAAGAPGGQPSRSVWNQRWVAVAVAVAAVLLIAVVVLRPRGGSAPSDGTEVSPAVATIVDLDRRIQLTADGRVTGLDRLETARAEQVTRTLLAGSLRFPDDLGRLTGPRGPLMGSAEAAGFDVSEPVATRIRATQPQFSWTPAPGAPRYVVTIAAGSEPVVTSAPVFDTRWTPPQPLAPGRYTWQVAALLDGGRELVAPAATAPPARFDVEEPSVASELERLPTSRLVRGIVFAERGLLMEAEAELRLLQRDNPSVPVVAAMLRQIVETRARLRGSAMVR